MDISILDLCLVNFVSYIFGFGTGLVICFKNKDKLLVRSRSLDNLSLQHNQHNHNQDNHNLNQPYISPVMASAPPPDIVPITIRVE